MQRDIRNVVVILTLRSSVLACPLTTHPFSAISVRVKSLDLKNRFQKRGRSQYVAPGRPPIPDTLSDSAAPSPENLGSLLALWKSWLSDIVWTLKVPKYTSTAFRGDFEDLRGKKEAWREMKFSTPTADIGPRIAHCKLDSIDLEANETQKYL
jgi:hypothetical protein